MCNSNLIRITIERIHFDFISHSKIRLKKDIILHCFIFSPLIYADNYS